MELKHNIEALLFACGRKISIPELAELLGMSRTELIKEALEELKQEYNTRTTPLMIIDEGEEWKLTVREKYIDLVRKINPNTELTKSLMETLAVIAWKQPIMQSEVIGIRTNKAYDHIEELEKIGFLNKHKHGRTYLLKLTQKFFDYFDLRDANAARALFKEIQSDEKEAQTKMEEFTEKEQHEPNKEERVQKQKEGTEEETVYSNTDRDELIEQDEITPDEDAFMDGYNEAEDNEEEKEKQAQ